MAQDPAPGATRVVDIALGEIVSSLDVDLRLDADSDVDEQPPINDDLHAFSMPAYLTVNGFPRAESRYGASVLTTGGVDALTKVTAPLDPVTLNLGSWARWLPLAAALEPPANGGRRWFPQGWAHVDASPKMSLYSVLPVGAGGIFTGRGTYGVGPSPYIDEGYVYSGFSKQMARPAMVFDGKAVAAIDPVEQFGSCTFGLVAVLHPSALSYYGLFEANNGGNGEPLVYRYAHGRVDVYQSHARVLSHETHKPAHYPVILLVSMDADTDTGRMLCVDQSRSSRSFNVEGLDFISMAGIVGALGQGTTTSPWQRASEMDLLELNLWDRALDFAEMESAANLLSLAYGVAG